MNRSRESGARTLLAFAAVYIIWGSTYLGIRIAVTTLPPFLMAGCRFLIAGGILYAVLRASRVAAPTAAEWGNAAVAGLLMLTVGNGAVTWAEEHGVPSNLAALLVAAVPLDIALFDWLRPGGQRPTRHVLIGIAIGFVGMVLLVLPDPGALARPAMGGVIAILIGGIGWAAGSLYARYGARNKNALMGAAQQMLIAGAAMLLVGAARGEHLVIATITWKSALAFGYLTVFGSLIAFSAYGWLVVASTPARLSTTAYVNPVIAVVLGWLLLGESLGPRALVGAALIIVAVVVMTAGGRRGRVRG